MDFGSADNFLGDLFTLGLEDLVVVLRCLNVCRVLISKDRADAVGDKLQEQVDGESDQSNQDAIDPLDSSKSIDMHGHESSEQLGADDLNDNNNSPDSHECWISGDSLKDVDLVGNLSRANHVEDLHEDEEVEDNCQVTGWSIILKGSVHLSLACVFLHSHQDIEVSFVPFRLEISQVVRILFL